MFNTCIQICCILFQAGCLPHLVSKLQACCVTSTQTYHPRKVITAQPHLCSMTFHHPRRSLSMLHPLFVFHWHQLDGHSPENRVGLGDSNLRLTHGTLGCGFRVLLSCRLRQHCWTQQMCKLAVVGRGWLQVSTCELDHTCLSCCLKAQLAGSSRQPSKHDAVRVGGGLNKDHIMILMLMLQARWYARYQHSWHQWWN